MPDPLDLRLEGVSKRYDDIIAVDDVSFAVPSGTYVVLLGPSGSGKTTVLSMLGGFTLPSAGRILVGAHDITLSPPAKRPTATVFQDYALFPHLGVAANVGFGLSVRGVPRAVVTEKVAAALRLVGLDGYGARAIAAMSGGQRQRIALARALVTEPALLLLDEPLGALDLSLRRQMQEELRHIQRSQARTFVHVTHDQEEAMAIADLIVIMNRGRIEDIGPTARVYERPRTRFSANFLGESTVVDGVVAVAADGHIAVDTECGRLVVEGVRDVGARVGVALRPEALRIGVAENGDQALGDMRVEECVYQGSFQRVTCTTFRGLRLLAKVEPRTLPDGGGTIAVCARSSGLILLED